MQSSYSVDRQGGRGHQQLLACLPTVDSNTYSATEMLYMVTVCRHAKLPPDHSNVKPACHMVLRLTTDIRLKDWEPDSTIK